MCVYEGVCVYEDMKTCVYEDESVYEDMCVHEDVYAYEDMCVYVSVRVKMRLSWHRMCKYAFDVYDNKQIPSFIQTYKHTYLHTYTSHAFEYMLMYAWI